jgi:GDP-4-dehydro-6-deoxy-D-mannose reductase
LKRLKKFLFVGSSDCYGIIKGRNRTLTEDEPFNPVSPYGISKAAAEFACRHYVRHHKLPVVVTRAFNHSGPRQQESFVIPAFARQIAAIEAGRQRPVIKVGDLSARRDLSDVRDVVRGYRLAAVKGRPGDIFHLCSGRAVAIRRVLDSLLSMTERNITVSVDKARLRKSELPVLRGSNRRATQRLGYRVRYKLKDTLRDTLDYWRSHYESGR